MNRIHKEAKLLGINELTSDVSKTTEPFFLRHDFNVVARSFPIRRGVTLQNALMRKDLHQGHDSLPDLDRVETLAIN